MLLPDRKSPRRDGAGLRAGFHDDFYHSGGDGLDYWLDCNRELWCSFHRRGRGDHPTWGPFPGSVQADAALPGGSISPQEPPGTGSDPVCYRGRAVSLARRWPAFASGALARGLAAGAFAVSSVGSNAKELSLTTLDQLARD